MESDTFIPGPDSVIHLSDENTVSFAGKLLVNQRITLPDSPEDVRHLEIEVEGGPEFQPGQHLGVLVPGPHAFGNEHHLRLYSLSGAETFPGTNRTLLQICVRRCLNIDEFSGEAYRGVASNYLCDRAPGDSLKLTGPYGSPFHIPEVNVANLLMIGLGTGIAPFRHFVRHIYDVLGGWEGKVRLFYGPHSGMEMLYMNDYKNDFAGYFDQQTFRAFESMSPKPHLGETAHLADTLLDHRREIWELMESPVTFVYVAGLPEIREHMDLALIEMAGSEGAWRKHHQRMLEEKRWTEVLY